MAELTLVQSAVGGALIGLASAAVLIANGAVAGISGMAGSLFQWRSSGNGWRLAFLAGLLLGGFVLAQAMPRWFDMSGTPRLPAVVVAGLLVGVGTRIGGGCTSGHGVCGISRLSPRSLVATGTFMALGALSVYVVRHLLAGAV